MSLLNIIISQYTKSRIQRIEEFIKNPESAQNEIFKTLIAHGKNTEYGKKYGFNNIKTIQDFRRNIPIVSYEQIFPYIEKMLNGQEQILWDSPVKWFAKSSGTTNARSKFIPVAKESLEEIHYKGGKDLLAIYLHNNPESDFFLGKGLALGGSHSEFNDNSDIKIGDVSAVIMQNLPIWAELMRTPDLKTALIENYEEKLEKIIEKTIHQNVTNIAGVPTWTYILIKKILEKTGKNNLLEIWSEFELYAHGGVSFEPYRALFQKLIPSENMRYYEIYNASEGYFAMQDSNFGNDMLLMLDYGIFYEFIPMEEIENPHPKTFGIAEVELHKNYAMVISTYGGLWRYLIGDTVKFTSLYPHKIKITGRTKHFINAFGEELVIENAENALRFATEKTNAVIRDYTAAPIYFDGDNSGCHQWLIEFENKPEDIHIFCQLLDQKLREINSDYDAKREKNMALKMPEIVVLPQNTFYTWLKQKNKLGGQHKIPRLSNSRDFAEEILGMKE